MATKSGDGGHVWPPREGDDRMELLTGSTTPTADVVFKALGAAGFTGSIDDRWAKYKIANSITDTSEPWTLSDNATPPITAALTGTITAATTEADIRTGGKTIILTLTNDTWVAAGTGPIGSTAVTQAIIDGLVSSGSETLGWNNVVRDGLVPADDVARTNNTTCTITLPAFATYDVTTASESITITIPAAALATSSVDVIGATTADIAIIWDAVPVGVEGTDYETTFHSMGFTWDVPEGVDTNHTDTIAVEYRQTDGTWNDGMNLQRIDYNGVDNFAGSLMFLTAGTEYEIKLTPSNGTMGATRNFMATTRALPVEPTGTVWYVDNNAGGTNSGTDANPWTSIAAANGNVSAGDIVKIRTGVGTYARADLTDSGSAAGGYIMWMPDTAATPVLDGVRPSGDYIWISGLTFTWDDDTTGNSGFNKHAIHPPGFGAYAPTDLVVTDCTFSGFPDAIINKYAGTRWTIMDNTITGDKALGVGDTTTNDFAGSGVDLPAQSANAGSGHVVAYNTITRVGDGINTGYHGNFDVYGNDVYDVSDDAIEMDASQANTRVWGNRCSRVGNYTVSWQDQEGGPWYLAYNQLGSGNHSWPKIRLMDRNVIVNNTIEGGYSYQHNFMRSFMRNNLHIAQASPAWQTSSSSPPQRTEVYVADWFTDIDYEGIDFGGSGAIINWEGNTVTKSTFADINSAYGILLNGVDVDADLIFDNKAFTSSNTLTLAAGANAAFEAGQIVNNISDWHGGTPDLGAFQRGATVHQFGVRGESGTALALRTENWEQY